MATKDYCLSLKNRQEISIGNFSNEKYSDLNLNHNNKRSCEEISSSKCITNNGGKAKNYDLTDANEKVLQRETSISWLNSNKTNLSTNYSTLDNFKNEKLQERKNSSKNNSTLSLHITAYENSIKGVLHSLVSDSNNDNENVGIKEKSGPLEKCEYAKLISAGCSSIQNPFEFPRQQKENQIMDPEVMKFKASQKLFNPNQLPALLSNQKENKQNAQSSPQLKSNNQGINLPRKTQTLRRSMSPARNESFMKQVLNALFSAGGVVLSYTVFSILQEEITRDTYGPSKEKFVYMQELVFVQCLAYCFVAFICKPRGSQNNESVPWYYYALAAASYTIAMVSSNSALKFVPYPTQVLCKSCKPLPVLLSGVLFASKRYHWRKFLYVTLIVAGMAIFMYKPQHSGKFDVLNFGTGEALLLLSLFMDGVTGTVQERMRSGYKTEKYSMMFYMNFFSGVLLSGSILFSHDLFKFVNFVQRYPFVLQRIALLSIAGACGQVFIFKTVSDFGPLTLSIITTSRKLISVVLSVILFSNPLNENQKIGTIVVFAALFLDGYDSSRRSKAAHAAAASSAASIESSVKAKKITPEASEDDDGFEKVQTTAAAAKAPIPPAKRRAIRRE